LQARILPVINEVEIEPVGDAAVTQSQPRPFANAAIGAIGGGLGAAAASVTLPIVLPFVALGGLAGYFLTNKIPSE
jgi:hypothetical protein